MKKVTARKLIAMLLIVAMIIPTFGMMYSSAASGDTVELAFNNLFVLESWANNKLSSTVLADGVPQTDGIVKDIENGSFTMTKIAVPETVYMQPSLSQDASVLYSTLGQFYVNNILDSSDYYNVKTVANAEDGMYFGVHSADASRYKVSVTNVTNPADDIILGNADGTGNVEGAWISIGTSGNDIKDEVYGLRFATKGLAPNEKATAKWEITIEYKDGTTKTYAAYTVLYAPMRTIGAVAEGRSTATQTNVISSWITGANGVDHSHRAPLGSFHADVHDSGYFKYDPLAYPNMSAISGTIYDMSVNERADDYIFTTDPSEVKDGGVHQSDDYSDTAYVLSTAPHDSDSTRAQSYLGLLAIDKSRYTNTNQIPNLNMGYDVLSLGTAPRNSLEKYSTYYTLGTSESFTATSLSATPSGWTQNSSYSRLSDSQSIPYRETVVPSYTVSDAIDGRYIHALNFGSCQAYQSYDYATAGTSVLIDVTDKGALRDAVLDGYTLPEENYSDDTYSKFEDALEDAATVLGDPSASQDEIDQAQKELEDAKDALVNIYYALKFDNLFSAYEYSQHLGSMTMNVGSNASIQYDSGKLTVVSNNTSTVDVYATEGNTSNFYNIDVNPSTEYVFEYDLTTDAGSQVILFFYDENGNAVASTNMTMQVGSGNPSSVANNSIFASYVKNDGHVVLKFTTNANVDRIGFRFGNTNNVVNESTFSNIRLIEADKYYADAQYSKTETVYKEFETYGKLDAPVRPGYTFKGWTYADGTPATQADLATAHKSIFSAWDAIDYTITYDANGGTGVSASKGYNADSDVTLGTPTKNGYTFAGWEVTSTDGNWNVGDVYQAGASTDGKYGNVTFKAVWTLDTIVVFYDTILEFNDWNVGSASKGTISNVTDNGFTLTSDVGVGEATSTSPYFPVTAGKQYYVDMDIQGDNWDVYIFFYDDATMSGLGIDFNDSANRFASNGGGNTTRTFTAPVGATKAVIRVDANGSSNSVTFSDVRIYEAGTREANVNVPFASKEIKYNSTFGEQPVPTKDGYVFKGWYDDNNNPVTADTVVTQTSNVYLHSVWEVMSVNEDSVVIDYGLPVRIHVCVNDQNMGEGTLTAIGTKLADGTKIGANAYNESKLVDGVTSGLVLPNGTASIDGNTIVYTPSNTQMSTENTFYYEFKTADGKYYYTTVTVIPATNIYYEEEFITFVNGDGYAWQDMGTPITGRFQSEDRPGEFSFADYDANNAYGNDSAYNDSYTYSLGSAKYTSVDADALGKEPTAKFTFCGTGFDLFSVTNSDTGAVLVTIYKAGTTTIYKNYLVSTYYGYTVDGGTLIPDTSSTSSVYQVPVISARELAYGTYDVVIKPIYSRAFDPNYVDGGVASNNAYGIYVDSVRIFNPAGSGADLSSDIIGDAYFADGEFAPMYMEIRDTVLSATEYYEEVIKGLNGNYTGSLFLDGSTGSGFDEVGIATYKEQGPNNELYLGKNQAIAFKVRAKDNLSLATLQVAMKVVAGDNAEVVIMNTNDNNPIEVNLGGAHEQFYRLDSVIVWNEVQDAEGNTYYETAYPIVIVNTSDSEDSVISLGSLKWAHSTETELSSNTLSINVDHTTGELAKFAVQTVIGENSVIDGEDISIEWSDTSFTEGKEATLTVRTPADILKVTIDGIEITDCVVDEDGNKVWTYSFIVQQSGETTYEILFFDEDGMIDEIVKIESVYIENGPDTDDAPSSDEPTVDEPNDDNSESVLDIIFSFIKKILDFFGGIFE